MRVRATGEALARSQEKKETLRTYAARFAGMGSVRALSAATPTRSTAQFWGDLQQEVTCAPTSNTETLVSGVWNKSYIVVLLYCRIHTKRNPSHDRERRYTAGSSSCSEAMYQHCGNARSLNPHEPFGAEKRGRNFAFSWPAAKEKPQSFAQGVCRVR